MVESNETFLEAIGLRVAYLRDSKGWNQEELADKSGLSKSSIAHIEEGSSNFKIDTLKKLADALSSTTDYIIYGVRNSNTLSLQEKQLIDELNSTIGTNYSYLINYFSQMLISMPKPNAKKACEHLRHLTELFKLLYK